MISHLLELIIYRSSSNTVEISLTARLPIPRLTMMMIIRNTGTKTRSLTSERAAPMRMAQVAFGTADHSDQNWVQNFRFERPWANPFKVSGNTLPMIPILNTPESFSKESRDASTTTGHTRFSHPWKEAVLPSTHCKVLNETINEII